jgi:hypothetical protein
LSESLTHSSLYSIIATRDLSVLFSISNPLFPQVTGLWHSSRLPLTAHFLVEGFQLEHLISQLMQVDHSSVFSGILQPFSIPSVTLHAHPAVLGVL